MATFPKLKTNAVAQYPATKAIVFHNQALRFVDGSEQRYRDRAGTLRRWTIRLSELDEGEMAALEQFFSANQGRFERFTFTDPWDNQQYPNCSLAADAMEFASVAELRGTNTVNIIEERV
jgi:hypothetical protein